MECESVQKDCLAPRISLDPVRIQSLMSCGWAVWPFTLANPGSVRLALGALEKLAGGVLSAVLMSPLRPPPSGDFLTRPNPFGAADGFPSPQDDRYLLLLVPTPLE